jgi:hypothetical protein
MHCGAAGAARGSPPTPSPRASHYQSPDGGLVIAHGVQPTVWNLPLDAIGETGVDELHGRGVVPTDTPVTRASRCGPQRTAVSHSSVTSCMRAGTCVRSHTGARRILSNAVCAPARATITATRPASTSEGLSRK